MEKNKIGNNKGIRSYLTGILRTSWKNKVFAIILYNKKYLFSEDTVITS